MAREYGEDGDVPPVKDLNNLSNDELVRTIRTLGTQLGRQREKRLHMLRDRFEPQPLTAEDEI